MPDSSAQTERAVGERRAIAAETLIELVRVLYEELHRGRPQGVTIDLHSKLEADLGFDSLSRAELLTRTEQCFGVHFPEASLATIETVGDLAHAVSRAAGRGAPGPERLVSAGPGPPTPPRRAGALTRATTLVQVLDWRAQRQPDATHVIVLGEDDTASVTYAELRDGARKVARGLWRAGIKPGARVALMLPTSLEYFFAFLGVVLAGAIPVPVYPPLRSSQLEEHVRRHTRILRNAGAQALITFKEARAAARLLAPRVASVEQVLSVEALADAEEPWTGGPPVAADSIAMLQYTSGSTGDPKGVILTHANVLANLRAMGRAIAVTDSEVFVSWLPLYHDMGLLGAWLGSLYFGCLFVVMPPTRFLMRPGCWLRAIHDYRATLSASPNFGYHLAARRITDEELEGLDLSCWRIAFNGAEPVIPETIERFAQRFAPLGFRPTAMTPVYGLAEAAVGLTFPPLDRGPNVDRIRRHRLTGERQAVPAPAEARDVLRLVSCGRALPGYRVRIIGPDETEEPERVEGAVQFTGPSATSGYYDNPDATERLCRDGWRDTGDLGYLADGELYITGRTKDLIIRRGHHIYPEEIERAVGMLEGVREGCVVAFGAAGPEGATERLIVLAETAYTDVRRREALHALINRRVLASVGEPPDEIVLAAPHTVLKTSSGKLRRSATRTAYLTGTLRRTPASPALQMLRLASTTALPALRRARRSSIARAYGLYAWLVAGVLAVPLALLLWMLPGRRVRWAVAHWTARWALRAWRIPLSVARAPERGRGRPGIVVANHCSYVDSVILVALLGQPHRFVAKRELERAPLLGSLLRRLGTLFIERDAPLASVAQIDQLKGSLAQSDALVIFPEGTFTNVTGLRPFRLGAFQLAVLTRVPVRPIALRGTRSVLRDGRWLPRRAPVGAWIGAPLEPSTADNTFSAAVQLRDAARNEILEHAGEPDLL